MASGICQQLDLRLAGWPENVCANHFSHLHELLPKSAGNTFPMWSKSGCPFRWALRYRPKQAAPPPACCLAFLATPTFLATRGDPRVGRDHISTLSLPTAHVPSGTHYTLGSFSSAPSQRVAWLLVVFSRPTLKTYRSARSKYLDHIVTLQLASQKRQPCSLGKPNPALGAVSTGHHGGQSHPFSETKTSQTSCLASHGSRTNKSENRW